MAGRRLAPTRAPEDTRDAREVRRSEAKYRTLFNSIDQGYCTIELLFDERDKPVDYRFLEINPAFEAQTGIQGAQGRTMREIAPLHEEHWFELYGRVALTGEPARFENHAAVLHRWFDVYAFRVGMPRDRTVGVLLSDITERKRADEAFGASEERYRVLLDGIEDYAVFMMDPKGHVLTWNAGAERIKGYRADEIIGQDFACFFPAEDIERRRPAEVLRLTAETGRHSEQGMRVRKDGTQFLAKVIVTALRDGAGVLVGFSEFSHDLSEREEFDGELAAGVANEHVKDGVASAHGADGLAAHDLHANGVDAVGLDVFYVGEMDAVFVAEGQIIQKVFEGEDAALGEQFGSLGANALDHADFGGESLRGHVYGNLLLSLYH